MNEAPSNNEASSGTSASNDGLGVLSCPFCGKAETVEIVDSDAFRDLMPWDVEPEGHTLYWAVMCDASKPGGKGGCGASGGFAPTKEAAAERWNTRAPNVGIQRASPASGEAPLECSVMHQLLSFP